MKAGTEQHFSAANRRTPTPSSTRSISLPTTTNKPRLTPLSTPNPLSHSPLSFYTMSSDEYNASDEEYEYEYTDDEDQDVTMTTTHNDEGEEEEDSKPPASEEKKSGSNKRMSSGSARENPQGAPVGIFDFGGE